MIRVGILAVQGAFAEHEKVLNDLGCECKLLRKCEDIISLDALVLPGGESTVQRKLINELNMLAPLKEIIKSSTPILATCAGMILLAKNVTNDEHTTFKTLPVTVKRNAYGRQIASFHIKAPLKGLGDVPMTFIRAPYIESVEEGVDVLARIKGKIVAVRYNNQLALSFHPELDDDTKIHRLFLGMK